MQAHQTQWKSNKELSISKLIPSCFQTNIVEIKELHIILQSNNLNLNTLWHQEQEQMIMVF